MTRTSATARAVSDADFDRLVRNVYKVLLTRGMVGTVIYSTDPETREALHHLTSRRTPVDASWSVDRDTTYVAELSHEQAETRAPDPPMPIGAEPS